MSYGYSRMKKLKKRASDRYQYMPNLNDMEDKECHRKDSLYNVMLEPFIIEKYKLWSVELAVRFCQENHIRTMKDCITYYGMRTRPEMYDCTWEQYIENNKEEK